MIQPDNDTVLIQKSLQGDQQAFSALVDRHGSLFLQTAYRLTGNWDDARDMVQEALLYAHASLGSLRDPQRFPSLGSSHYLSNISRPSEKADAAHRIIEFLYLLRRK